MRPYTDLHGFESIVLEESFVLGIQATPGAVEFRVDLVLARDHPDFRTPQPGDAECFRLGVVRFRDVQRVTWSSQGAQPASDATGDLDYGHIDSFVWDRELFELNGNWGAMEVVAASGVRVSLD
jgi:hypothetical protein